MDGAKWLKEPKLKYMFAPLTLPKLFSTFYIKLRRGWGGGFKICERSWPKSVKNVQLYDHVMSQRRRAY